MISDDTDSKPAKSAQSVTIRDSDILFPFPQQRGLLEKNDNIQSEQIPIEFGDLVGQLIFWFVVRFSSPDLVGKVS